MTDTVDDETLRRIFGRDRVIAVVGASPNWDRPSCRIMQYLQAMDYRIFPVNPRAAGGEILGRKVYATLADVTEPGDTFDRFLHLQMSQAASLQHRPCFADRITKRIDILFCIIHIKARSRSRNHS